MDASPKKRIRIEKPSSVKATHNEDVKKESTQNEDIKKESSSSTSPSPTTTTISLNATNTKKRRQEDEECVLDLDECLIHSQFLDEPMSVHSSCHIIVEDVSESEAGFVNSTAPPPSDVEPQPAIQDSSSCRRKKASGPLRRSARLAGKGLGSFYVGRVRRSARLALLL